MFKVIQLFLGAFTTAVVLIAFFSGNVQAKEEPLVKTWLTFTHGQIKNGYNVMIHGDRPFNVDNHFLIVDPPRLVVDIAEAQIHKNLYLKVEQPGLSMIRAANRDSRVRVVLDLPKDSPQKYELVEQQNRVTIKLLAHVKKQPTPIPRTDGKVSIQLHKAELADFFAIISKASGRTIRVDESIKTRISLRLVDISWADALAHVLKLYKLEVEEQGDVWYASSSEK